MFQDNYKVTCITLTEATLVLYWHQLWIFFFFFCYFHMQTLKGILKNKFNKTFKIFKEIYDAVPSVPSCQNSFIVKTWNFKERDLTKDQKSSCIKIYQERMIKSYKITSIEAILVNLLPNLKMLLLLEITIWKCFCFLI